MLQEEKEKHLHTLSAYLRNLNVTKQPRFGKMTAEMKKARKEVQATKRTLQS